MPPKPTASVPSQYSDVQEWFDALCKIKSCSKLERWAFFSVVMHEGTVNLQCVDCNAKLSAKNVSSTLKGHVKFQGDTLVCSTRASSVQKIKSLVTDGAPFFESRALMETHTRTTSFFDQGFRCRLWCIK